jgi:hypothetical protein
MRAGVREREGDFVNGERLVVSSWDAEGNPVASDGRSISPGATCPTCTRPPRTPAKTREGLKVITGFDRHSVHSATQKIAYVAASRGREGIEAFVESVADLSQIQNRNGDRKAAVEMAFEDRLDDRDEMKWLFRHLQRIRAAKETGEHARTVDLCRQAAETLEPSKVKTQAVDLQEHAIRSAQESARQAKVLERHAELTRPKNAPWSAGVATRWACERGHEGAGFSGCGAPVQRLPLSLDSGFRRCRLTARRVSALGSRKQKTANDRSSGGFVINPPQGLVLTTDGRIAPASRRSRGGCHTPPDQAHGGQRCGG